MTQAHGDVFRLYWAYFDRQPDPGGALYWAGRIDGCDSLAQVAQLFAVSEEFEGTYGKLTDHEFVHLVYNNVLDRDAESEGFEYWLNLVSKRGLTRGGMMVEFSRSEEFTSSHPMPSDNQEDRACRRSGNHTTDLQAFDLFAVTEGVDLHLPSEAVETIGYHESTHDGSKQMVPADTAVEWHIMDSRGRGNPSTGAADIAVHPLLELRSPVTGTVKRSGTYTLYCRYSDDFLVIAPDAQPTWEVKVLHIRSVQVAPGDRVVAGETVISPGARPLPFRSQVDAFTPNPSWAHVHIEILDPAVPDRPGPGC